MTVLLNDASEHHQPIMLMKVATVILSCQLSTSGSTSEFSRYHNIIIIVLCFMPPITFFISLKYCCTTIGTTIGEYYITISQVNAFLCMVIVHIYIVMFFLIC